MPWYVDADEHAKEDKWLWEAVYGTDLVCWPNGEHCAEAMGPKIQGNPLGLESHVCVPFDNCPGLNIANALNTSFDALKSFPDTFDSRYSPGHLAEGIVFHHLDGRRAKIKRKDFAR